MHHEPLACKLAETSAQSRRIRKPAFPAKQEVSRLSSAQKDTRINNLRTEVTNLLAACTKDKMDFGHLISERDTLAKKNLALEKEIAAFCGHMTSVSVHSSCTRPQFHNSNNY